MIQTESEKVRAQIPLSEVGLVGFLTRHNFAFEFDGEGKVWTSYATLVAVRDLLQS